MTAAQLDIKRVAASLQRAAKAAVDGPRQAQAGRITDSDVEVCERIYTQARHITRVWQQFIAFNDLAADKEFRDAAQHYGDMFTDNRHALLRDVIVRLIALSDPWNGKDRCTLCYVAQVLTPEAKQKALRRQEWGSLWSAKEIDDINFQRIDRFRSQITPTWKDPAPSDLTFWSARSLVKPARDRIAHFFFEDELGQVSVDAVTDLARLTLERSREIYQLFSSVSVESAEESEKSAIERARQFWKLTIKGFVQLDRNQWIHERKLEI
jgi:hypothetical protein